MKKIFTKILLFILIGTIIYSCNSLKKVPDEKYLLTKNTIVVDNKKVGDEKTTSLLYQQPNSKFFVYPLRLHLYNLSKENADSSYNEWLHRKPNRYKNLSALLSEKQVERLGASFFVSGYSNLLKKVGEAPVLIDHEKIKKSALRLKNNYANKGYFDVKSRTEIDTISTKKVQVTYEIIRGHPYIIDSIQRTIRTPILDSLYQDTKSQSFLKTGKQYDLDDFKKEMTRITNDFRNKGIYYFQQNYISFNIDTIQKKNKASINLLISDRTLIGGDTTKVVPFKRYKISRVNVFVNKTTKENHITTKDSVSYNGFNIYSYEKLRYKPKALTDPIFINYGSYYSDIRKTLTYRYLNNLRIFEYPTIQFLEDSNDSEGESLIANVILTPLKKHSFNPSIDLTHSNIQDLGILGSLSLTFRNIFRGAETLEISGRGNIGYSKDLARPGDPFFNIIEYGTDAKLTFPRIFMPFNTSKIIPRTMIPSTLMSFGYTAQKNIGLDKESFTGLINFNWFPKRNTTAKFELINIQYVNNLNVANYFNVYRSSFDRLNQIAQRYRSNVNPDFFDDNTNLIIEEGTTGFINDVLSGKTPVSQNSVDYKSVRSILERQQRLTENNLIFSSAYTFTRSTKKDLFDNDFFSFKTKIESAGAFLYLLSNLTLQKRGENGQYSIFDIDYSQYIKTEFDFIKHWDLGRTQVFATRFFSGIAIPYANSNNIPFARSYFGGGTNDIRGWQSYSLGPGSSGGLNDFNEANFKITISAEYRFRLAGSLHSALFIDTGNIWNVFDNTIDPTYIFKGFNSLEEFAIASGIGFRYDVNFFIIRFDVGFKTYNPAKIQNERWFRELTLNKAVLNIGINYPF